MSSATSYNVLTGKPPDEIENSPEPPTSSASWEASIKDVPNRSAPVKSKEDAAIEFPTEAKCVA
ncbi:MAG: hypothetical protein JXQ75_21455 [Phycisphaerae bacterium]|nr:hypothetical protein [Phycisphaerae bacterium]